MGGIGIDVLAAGIAREGPGAAGPDWAEAVLRDTLQGYIKKQNLESDWGWKDNRGDKGEGKGSRKHQMCRGIEQGHCRKGIHCEFAHSEEERKEAEQNKGKGKGKGKDKDGKGKKGKDGKGKKGKD